MCALLIAGTVLRFPPAAAQTAAGSPPPLAESLQIISRSMARVPNASVSLNFAEFKVRMATAKLQEVSAAWSAEAPADYRANVAAQASLLQQALQAPDADALTRILEALADDLTTKAGHAEKGGPATVAVTVRVVRQGQEASGWQVVYRPRVADAAGSSGAEGQFQAVAGPARANLVPGRYIMWGRQGSSNSAPAAFAVGEGLPDASLDLDVTPRP